MFLKNQWYAAAFPHELTNEPVARTICGEPVLRITANAFPDPSQVGGFSYLSDIPEGLASKVNDIGNWAVRGMLLWEPTDEQEWILGIKASKVYHTQTGRPVKILENPKPIEEIV